VLRTNIEERMVFSINGVGENGYKDKLTMNKGPKCETLVCEIIRRNALGHWNGQGIFGQNAQNRGK
jgi:hypothetical protein